MAMRLSCTLALAALATPALAEDELKLSGSVRLRYETISGQARTGFNDSDDLVSLRSIVALDFRRGDLQLYGELRDSRIYNVRAGTPFGTGEVNAIEPVQAFVGYDAGDALGPNSRLTVQAGRFTANLGSRRLVSSGDYRNTTNGYAGARIDIAAPGKLAATLIYTLPQVRLPDNLDAVADNRVELDRQSFDLVLWGGVVSHEKAIGASTAELSFFHLGEADAPGMPTRNRSLDTFGIRLVREPHAGAWDHDGEIFYQRGTVRAGLAPGALRQEVAAWFVHAEVGYSFPIRWSPRLSVEFDFASGQKGNGKFRRFDTLFGARRSELGPSGLYNAVGRANILTPGLRIEATPTERIDGFLVYRPMWLASRTDAFSTTGVRDASGQSGRFAGQQIEGRIRYWLVPKRLRLEANGALLLKGRFLQTAPNAPDNGDTRYLSMSATVSF